MHALVKRHRKPGLWLEKDVPVPEMGSDEVLIKILRTSICGTDLHIYNWDDWAQKTVPVPMVIGHEFVGRIVAVGDRVSDFKTGMLVCGEGHLVCGHCRNCLAGRRHLCIHTKGIGYHCPGAFGEYFALTQSNVWLCDPKIPLDVLSCFDPLGNAVHTALSFDVLGEDVLITGAGPMGCMAAAICKHAGARNVVVTDLNEYRLNLARTMGATLAVDPRKTSLKDVMTQLGMKEGFDVGLEVSGNATALNSMLDVMEYGGKVALLGLGIHGPEAAIDWDRVVFHSITLKGVYGREMYETWYKMTAMLQSGLDISAVITHQFPYTEFEKGFELMRSGHSGKIVLDWENGAE